MRKRMVSATSPGPKDMAQPSAPGAAWRISRSRTNITVPEDLLAKIDRYAAQHGYTRSGLLVATVRDRIKRD